MPVRAHAAAATTAPTTAPTTASPTAARNRLMLTMLPLAGLALLFLGGCAIEVNDRDSGRDGYYKPRGATDLCRREVERTYDDRFRIAYELPELVTQGTSQLVTQEFSLTPRKDYGTGIERRAIRCTVTDGALTSVTPVK